MDHNKNASYSRHFHSQTKLLTGTGPTLGIASQSRATLHSILAPGSTVHTTGFRWSKLWRARGGKDKMQ